MRRPRNAYGRHKALIGLFLSIIVSGCATPQTPVTIRSAQEVKTVVSQGCKFEWPEKPNNYVAALLPEARRAEKLKAALAEREELKAYVPQLEAILKGCEKDNVSQN